MGRNYCIAENVGGVKNIGKLRYLYYLKKTLPNSLQMKHGYGKFWEKHLIITHQFTKFANVYSPAHIFCYMAL